MVNQSKVKDQRFWKKWKNSGAVGNIQGRINPAFALLINGYDDPEDIPFINFSSEIAMVHKYLLDEAAFQPERIEHIDCNRESFYSFCQRYYAFFRRVRKEDPKQNVVIFCAAHGIEEIITPFGGKESTVPVGYKDLAKHATNEGNILFVVDSCHSGSAIPFFIDNESLSGRVGVIASCSADRTSPGFDPFFKDLFYYCRQGKPYKIDGVVLITHEAIIRPPTPDESSWPEIERRKLDVPIPLKVKRPVRGGKDLDHLLYAAN